MRPDTTRFLLDSSRMEHTEMVLSDLLTVWGKYIHYTYLLYRHPLSALHVFAVNATSLLLWHRKAKEFLWSYIGTPSFVQYKIISWSQQSSVEQNQGILGLKSAKWRTPIYGASWVLHVSTELHSSSPIILPISVAPNPSHLLNSWIDRRLLFLDLLGSQ